MFSSIPVICFTNLDDYSREDWPTEFSCRPMVGDVVQSCGGKELKVVRVTHRASPLDCSGRLDLRPHLKVELHK
ncbi:hypothetical protein LCGC14_1781920 [marine sediment metagenome]|uniref:Uncharacterized protein n=1 Tax=marine sediment metagenome TaxID=412755 RepID=A0A0F9JUQ1_9ZZZZ